ncbi:MAG: chlorite dismutase family protein [Actinomycetota bacterium]|nr:chlorite dismutase family protein [Actinomycetota bacterium]
MGSDQSSPAASSTGATAEHAAEGRGRVTARDINDQIRYTLFSVFSRIGEADATVDDCAAELQELVDEQATVDVQIRGFYDVSALRSDADLMVWWHAPSADALQDAARRLRRTAIGRILLPAWSGMGLHRPAEFNKGHIPAFLADTAAKNWATVYPFVRSYEWYLLPDTERRSLLAEHGMMGRKYQQVLSNTVAAFALGDYEWLLALESDELHDIVDLMRHLRGSETRRHVREEIPFFTGRRIEPQQVAEALA